MIISEVKNHNGVPTLFVNGEPFPSCAYMIYLEEYNNYSLFAEAGYKLFSVPVLFAGRWISVTEGMKPFHAGIFDKKGNPDFSSLEHSLSLILSSCPDALIIPRINMSMPLWWIEENPDCLDSTGNRELLSSTKWRKAAGELLEEFLTYLTGSEFYGHIAGLHLAGGNTEEWFYFDLNGGCCENAMPYFREYLEKNHPGCEYKGLPDLSPLSDSSINLHGSEYLTRFIEFSDNSVADAIAYFASVAKRVTKGNLAAGVFYGYTLEVPTSLHGTHALEKVLECDDIDFISSPNSYIGIRDPGIEWTEMYPADSVRLHGKMCMQECDIRTHLTRPLCECAPEYDTRKRMTAPIWQGLKSKEDSLRMIRKSFSRQMKKGNGLWWFDMWGGWYNDPDIMSEMKAMHEEYEESLKNPVRKKKAVVAVFVDESAFSLLADCALRYAPFSMREQLGQAFDDYDMYDVFDFDAVKDRYDKMVFLSGRVTPLSERSVRYCEENGIPFLCNSFGREKFTVEELKKL